MKSRNGISQNIHAKPHIVMSPGSRPSDRAGLPGLFDVVGRLSQDLRHSLERWIVGSSAPGPLEGGSGEPGEGALHLADAAAGEVTHRLSHPVDDLVQQVAMLLQVALTLRSDVINLLA